VVRGHQVFPGSGEHIGKKASSSTLAFPVAQNNGVSKDALYGNGSWPESVVS
jgi:hypothetical protein